MKIIITVSPGNSGGGAVHDYLLSRTDFVSPFQGEEFRLITDPYGINNLHQGLYKNFSLNNSSEAFYQFEKYCNNLKKLKLNKTNKLIYGENFYNLSTKYLSNISLLKYKGIPQFKSISLDYKKKIAFKIKKKFFGYKNFEHGNYEMHIPVDEKKFLLETKKFLKLLISSNCKNLKNKNIILDQATSFWIPELVSKYFDNLKIILVTRDPRSVYYSMKFRGSYAYPGYNLKKFVRWYDEIFKKKRLIGNSNNKNLIHIEFEKFFQDNLYKIKLEKFLKIPNKSTKNFNYKFTKNNIYKARKNLSKFELKYIEKNLKNYLQW